MKDRERKREIECKLTGTEGGNEPSGTIEVSSEIAIPQRAERGETWTERESVYLYIYPFPYKVTRNIPLNYRLPSRN